MLKNIKQWKDLAYKVIEQWRGETAEQKGLRKFWNKWSLAGLAIATLLGRLGPAARTPRGSGSLRCCAAGRRCTPIATAR